jgi:hypothetical protein
MAHAGGPVQAGFDGVLDAACAAVLDGEAVSVRPTIEDWRKSGR